MTSRLCRCTIVHKVVPMTLESAEDAVSFALQCVPGLMGCSRAEIDVAPLTGGLTNVLHVVRHRERKTLAAVVRRFGEGTEALVNRNDEEFWVTALIGSFGRCANGIAFRFLSGFHPATPEEFRSRHRHIAAQIAKLHVTAANASLVVRPWSNTPNFCLEIMLGSFVRIGTSNDVGRLLPKSPVVTKMVETILRESVELRRTVSSLSHLLQEGYCHNDLNMPNTMIGEGSDGQVQFIDFEYMARNYLLYDIANHFNEYAGYNGDWAQVPSHETKIEFLKCYFTEMTRLTMPDHPMVIEGDFEAELALVEYLSLVSHVGWAAWSLAQAARSKIDFDYIEYAAMRLARYAATKEEATTGILSLLPPDERQRHLKSPHHL